MYKICGQILTFGRAGADQLNDVGMVDGGEVFVLENEVVFLLVTK